MNSFVVFYSKSGNTKKIAKIVSEKLGSDLEEIKDLKNRKGFFGFMISGFEAVTEKPSKIAQIEKNPENYDLVIVCTPVWAGSLSSPVRTYLQNYGKSIKKIAFIACCGLKPNKTFNQMQKLSKEPINSLYLTEEDMRTDNYILKIDNFIENIK